MSLLPQAFRRLGADAKGHIDDAISSTLAIHPVHDGAEGDTQLLLLSAETAVSSTRRALGAVTGELDGQVDLPHCLEELGDAAFIARLSAGQLGAELDRARATSDHWQVVRAASKVRRNLLRALRTLDRLVCTALGIEPDSSYYDREVRQALEARLAYNRLRADSSLVRGRSAASALRAALVSLQKLGRFGYGLRVEDRLLVRQLERRIGEWLGQHAREPQGADVLAGKRLLSDYFSFVGLVHEVNKRPELMEHDAEHLVALLRVWDRVDDSELERVLEVVRGRDEYLDELVQHRAPRELIRKRVEAVANQLVGPWQQEAESGTFPALSSGTSRSAVSRVSTLPG